MNITNTLPGSKKGWMKIMVAAAMLAAGTAAQAQEGSQGNTTIFGGAQMTFFGNHNFLTGGSGTQPGVILTERATANISYLNFSGNGLTATGVTDASYVDGYVRKYGTGQFIFPVGDNGNAGQFAASADGTSGAYFHADPSVAVTTNLFTGTNYPALPSGGPFDRTLKATTLGSIDAVEYWDIDGATATPITLTWDAGSDVNTLTGATLSKLTIAGWNGTQWVKIPSTIDATSVLGGASSATGGSITTSASIVPNNYTAYTLAALVPDLTPTTDIDGLNFAVGASRDFVVNIFEINNVLATGQIRFRINKLSGFTITYPTASGTSNVFGGSPIENGNWDFTENASFITVTAKAGITIPANGQAALGFHVVVNAATPILTAQNITATIIGGSGGEIRVNNNNVVTTISRN